MFQNELFAEIDTVDWCSVHTKTLVLCCFAFYCIGSLKPKLVWIILKDTVRSSKKTLHFSIENIKWLTPFKKTITAYTENHIKRKNTLCG
jgi:hypothetical protein